MTWYVLVFVFVSSAPEPVVRIPGSKLDDDVIMFMLAHIVLVFAQPLPVFHKCGLGLIVIFTDDVF